MDSTATKRTIVVLAATGQQGGAVAQALVTDGRWQVRALSRDPSSHGARLLSVAGIEVVRADMDDLDSLRHAMAGTYGVFSVQGTDRGGDIETARGIDVAEAARFAGVKHFIYSSVGGAERSSGIAHFESKWRVEEYIRASKRPALASVGPRPSGRLQRVSSPENNLHQDALETQEMPIARDYCTF